MLPVSDSISAYLLQCRRNSGPREWRRVLSDLRIRPGLKAAASRLLPRQLARARPGRSLAACRYGCGDKLTPIGRAKIKTQEAS
jgi:hypothetical protein